MALDLEELRRQKEKLEREREELEKQIAEAERKEREKAAVTLVTELRDLTTRIDAMKEERHKLLMRIREAAPRLGDFTYAQDDWRLTLQSARASMKQPELLDKVLAALAQAELHVEPRTPKFRVFRALRPVGQLQVAPKRLVLVALEPVLDPAIIEEARAIDAKYPGLVSLEMASAKKERRVREGVPSRLADGDFALSMAFAANDTGTLDTVLPLALRALDHVAAYWDGWTPDSEARLFEPWPHAPGETKAPEAAPAAPEAKTETPEQSAA